MDIASLGTQFITWAQSLADSWGYLGIFIVSVLGNASIIFPIPSYAVVIAFGAILNPWIVGITAGAGAALGELTGYIIGFGGRKAIKKKHKKLLEKSKKWFERHGAFPIIVLFAATPLPDDIVGILAGIIKYNLKKFLAASLIGKCIAHITLAWAGYLGSVFFGGMNVFFGMIVSFILLLVVYRIIQGESRG